LFAHCVSTARYCKTNFRSIVEKQNRRGTAELTPQRTLNSRTVLETLHYTGWFGRKGQDFGRR